MQVENEVHANKSFSAVIHSPTGTNTHQWSAATYKVNGVQVLTSRQTGFVAMTGTPDKGSTFATSSVTLAQLAGRVMSLQAALTSHGIIGA
jgi:hypothetical protein